MKLNVKKLLKKILIVVFMIYFVITIYNQQKTLNSYRNNIASVEKEINEKVEQKEALLSMKENANSLEYIERIAREKLHMYKPTEKVYIDINS